jgi:hypothetical protein
MFRRKSPQEGETAKPIQAVERITSVLGAGVIWHGSINGSLAGHAGDWGNRTCNL